MQAKLTSGERVTWWGRTANVVALVAVAVILGVFYMQNAISQMNNNDSIRLVNYANTYGLAFITAVLAVARGLAGYVTWLMFSQAKRLDSPPERFKMRVHALVIEGVLLIAGFGVALVGTITTDDWTPWVAGSFLVLGLVAQDVCALVGAERDERAALRALAHSQAVASGGPSDETAEQAAGTPTNS